MSATTPRSGHLGWSSACRLCADTVAILDIQSRTDQISHAVSTASCRFGMMVRARNRVPIYGPIYEAHDFYNRPDRGLLAVVATSRSSSTDPFQTRLGRALMRLRAGRVTSRMRGQTRTTGRPCGSVERPRRGLRSESASLTSRERPRIPHCPCGKADPWR